MTQSAEYFLKRSQPEGTLVCCVCAVRGAHRAQG